MNMDVLDGHMQRELRRRQLAMRLIHHHARTQTIEDLASYTRHQLTTLRRRAGVPTDSRFRGPAPTSFDVFFSSPRARNECAALAFLHWAHNVPARGKRDGDVDVAMGRGERLCDVYELWRRLVPGSHMEFEHLTLLGEGLGRADAMSFDRCSDCGALLVIDPLSTKRKRCDHCLRHRRKRRRRATSSASSREDEEAELTLYTLQLTGGQLLRGCIGAHPVGV